jgi:hypothetical protein
MARRKRTDEDVVVVSDDDAAAERAAVADAAEQQESLEAGDVSDASVDEVAAFNAGQRAEGDAEDQVQAPADDLPDDDIEDILPSEGDYANVRDPNYQFQESGKYRLVEGEVVPLDHGEE